MNAKLKEIMKKEIKLPKLPKLPKELIFTIIAIISIVVFCVALTPVTLQNDTYYTIKIGEHIQNVGIDMKDPFSWHEGLNYTYPHWLYDLLTFKIYDAFGFTGIYIATCVLSSILGLMIFFVNSKTSKNKVLSYFITLGVMYLIEGYIAARAQLVTFILFILEIFIIEKFIEKKKIGYALTLIGISILMANLHVAVWPFFFVLFMPYIGEYIIAGLADFIIYKKPKELFLKLKLAILKNKEKYKEQLSELNQKVEKIKIKRAKNIENPYKIRITKNINVRWLIIIMIICGFTGLLTPIGDTPYTYLYKTMQGNTTQNINEHLPMTIANQPEVMCVIIVFLSIMTFTKAKIKLSDLFLIGGLALLMLYTRRQLSLFAIIGSIVLSRLFVELKNLYGKDFFKNMKLKIIKPIFILLIIIWVGWFSYDKLRLNKYRKVISELAYPVEACDYILENIDLSKARFYNEYNFGSYMLYRGIPVFIDSRADLYAPEFSGLTKDIFMDFLNVSSIGEFYEDVFNRYGITHAIMDANAKISMIIDKTNDPHYKKIYSDDFFVIYERVTNN